MCLKIIKNNKDYFDQSLDEIKLLRYVNACDPADEHSIVRLYDFFYYKVRLLTRLSAYTPQHPLCRSWCAACNIKQQCTIPCQWFQCSAK